MVSLALLSRVSSSISTVLSLISVASTSVEFPATGNHLITVYHSRIISDNLGKCPRYKTERKHQKFDLIPCHHRTDLQPEAGERVPGMLRLTLAQLVGCGNPVPG